MEIPASILRALDVRENSAYDFMDANYEITEFLNEYGIEVDPCDIDGVEALYNPTDSKNEIIRAIEDKEE